MVHTLNLGGRARKVLCGNYTFKKLRVENGITFADIAQALQAQDLSFLSDAIYHSLRAAEIYDNVQTPDEYDADRVAVWMDMEPGSTLDAVEIVLDAIADVSGTSDSKEFVEAKKKMKAAKKSSTGQK